jgi:hypothetical protein
MSSCGSGFTEDGMPEISAQGIGSGSGGATFTWSSKIKALAVTIVRLCWCGDAAGSSSCNSAADFGLDFGVLQVSGPAKVQSQLQSFSCYMGMTCSISNLKGDFSEADDTLLVMPVSYCGDAVLEVSGFPIADTWTGLSRSALTGESGLATGGGKNFTWGSNFVNAEPGFYHLCWCRGAPSGCTSRSDYMIAAARLSLEGPVIGQVFQCVVDEDCTIQGVRGNGLDDNDYVEIISYLFTCTGQYRPEVALGNASATSGSGGADFAFPFGGVNTFTKHGGFAPSL